MTLRNAFDQMATEGSLRRLIDAVTFPKDVAGRQRVIIDTGSTTAVTGTVTTASSTAWGNANVSPLYYAAGGPAAMDAREVQKLASHQAAALSRQKWTY